MITGQGPKATKEEMISWAMLQHPEANWPMRTEHGKQKVVSGQAEHMADAVATIHAGVDTPNFREYLGNYLIN